MSLKRLEQFFLKSLHIIFITYVIRSETFNENDSLQHLKISTYPTNLSRHIVLDVLFYERKDCPLKGDSEAKINSLSLRKCLDTLKNTFVERSTQYMSFSSSKQPPNTGIECKQFTENASEALQQTILTHAHTRCPPARATASQQTMQNRL